MFLLSFLLLPLALATSTELSIDNYIINIENNILTNIESTERSTLNLNLAGLGLHQIKNGTFANLNIKILNLANNSFINLPELLFSNLTNLEHLSLANNNLKIFNNTFFGLTNLKTLNISNNPIETLEPGEFYGLSTSVNIFTLNTSLKKISTRIFDKSSSIRSRRDTRIRPEDFPKSTIRIKACLTNGKLNVVDTIRENETLTSDCTEIISAGNDKIYIENLNITSFESGWFRIEKPIWMISISNNLINEITREMLNDLPKSVSMIDLDNNKIEFIKNGVIENYYIQRLWMTRNLIKEIEEGAFDKTNIEDLNLDDNLLSNLKFVKSLPTNFKVLTMQRNLLTEIPNDTFLNHKRFDWLRFDGNQIKEIYKNSFRGISHLYKFGLSDNKINKIEEGSFKNISIRNFFLRNNSLENLEIIFPNEINFLDLGMNKFNNLKEIRNKLPKKLHKFFIDFNYIENLNSGDFDDLSIWELSLRGNKIKNIEKGSMNLREITWLDLGENLLSEVSGEIFENFDNIWEVRLDRNNITKIEKGFGKHLYFLTLLDISKNFVKKLENGAFYGIRKGWETFILTEETPIEIIQGGIFQNV